MSHSSTLILSILGSSSFIGRLVLQFARLPAELREQVPPLDSSYRSFSASSTESPYYSPAYSRDFNWTSPVFTYARYENLNLSVVSTLTKPGAGESIFFISEFLLDTTSQDLLLTALGNDVYYVYFNGEFIAGQRYPMYISETLSISYGGKFQLAAQVVSSGVHTPFLHVKIVGQRDNICYLHSASNPSTWNWYLNEAKVVPGMINITKAVNTRELYELPITGVSLFDSSYPHERWPFAQTRNFYHIYPGETPAIGLENDTQPFGTYFVFAQFDVDRTGSYKVTLKANDVAYVYLDSKRFRTVAKNDTLTFFTTRLNCGTHFLVVQVVNNRKANAEELHNTSVQERTGFHCNIISENSGSSVLKSTEGYHWRIFSDPRELPGFYV
ncbi:hypothetical protein GAYE_SCF06G2692 [Galdieria yellowstonensis]|uniref:PA14 domain-containing protein n=1 Tax=Galdieria yellowstonensis TaxID=3028027 RepID=A0AAV9IBT0_9RHOD|nr:hypothetical protein GAYE_SCF06G2692 [Galdieria yellowstonensis]